MTDKEVIRLLTEQNERLLKVLEKFAEQDTHIVVNSYNGSNAHALNDNSSNEEKNVIGDNNTNDVTSSQVNRGTASSIHR